MTGKVARVRPAAGSFSIAGRAGSTGPVALLVVFVPVYLVDQAVQQAAGGDGLARLAQQARRFVHVRDQESYLGAGTCTSYGADGDNYTETYAAVAI